MKRIILLIIVNIILPQLMNSQEQNTVNPLLCDIKEGVCETGTLVENIIHPQKTESNNKKITVYYFTDPICSSCWGIEPQLKRLQEEYGKYYDIKYIMGGLLPDWSYNSGGISKPSDVAHHWDEVSAYYQMPIDGDVWLENPLSSSYPASIAYHAVALQDETQAKLMLRLMREQVFLMKQNISDNEVLMQIAKKIAIDTAQFREDFLNGKAKEAFLQDLEVAKQFRVRGFPTLIFKANDKELVVYGFKPYEQYENAIKFLKPDAQVSQYTKDTKIIFKKHITLTAKEYSILSGLSYENSLKILDELVQSHQLFVLKTKNGNLYSIDNSRLKP